MKKRLFLIIFTIFIFVITGCEADKSQSGSNPRNGDTDDTDDNPSDSTDSGHDSFGGSTGIEPRVPECGDGVLDDDEACDDGNTIDGDGCFADCKEVEKGFICYPPGFPCRKLLTCGDGIIDGPEQCDDGNLENGDGCNDFCQVEIGWKCEGEPSICTPTTCGDGIKEGAESCDDGNDIPFDGCSPTCQKEPHCPPGQPCTSVCGDGLVLGDEECDDGNNIDGDGCSSDCKIEEGFTCSVAGCQGDDCIIEIYAIFRDFSMSHTDFEVNCGSSLPVATTGLVNPILGDDNKPEIFDAILAQAACIHNFDDWYNAPISKVETIKLYPDGNGNFVNRFGPNGEQWVSPGAQISTTGCESDHCLPCWDYGSGWDETRSCEKIYHNGNPMFLPLNDMGNPGEFRHASIPPNYWIGWVDEKDVTGEENYHNFSFTTEIVYWFKYDENTPAILHFLGDDDVWVFVNRQLALDLGGAHVPIEDSIIIGGPQGEDFGMEHGNVYQVNIFHAERKATGSSFKLTLGGFQAQRSVCRPTCGDGVIVSGEECDDGINAGGYGQCGPDCKIDGYCGDGIIQKEYENCDDGPENGQPGKCPRSCRIIQIK